VLTKCRPDGGSGTAQTSRRRPSGCQGRPPGAPDHREAAIITTRTAFIGGGSAGIGNATAEHLLRTGHRVVITGRNAAALDAAADRLRHRTGGDVQALAGDMAETSAAGKTLAEAEARYGAMDVLVLNAGGPPPGGILDIGDEQWRTAYELLLLGPLALTRAALPRMAERGFGRAVFITSTAVRQPQPDLAVSVVLRSAVTAAAKLLAREFAGQGVTVNCVAPGPTSTERRAEILRARAARTGSTFEALDAGDAAAVPAGRAGRPQEIAAAVAFLASDAASYINGTVLTVDGGRTETI
jgi:3-oxoacyl-[acyl-carrier protein] reductase